MTGKMYTEGKVVQSKVAGKTVYEVTLKDDKGGTTEISDITSKVKADKLLKDSLALSDETRDRA
jgi:hypothetical protein